MIYDTFRKGGFDLSIRTNGFWDISNKYGVLESGQLSSVMDDADLNFWCNNKIEQFAEEHSFSNLYKDNIVKRVASCLSGSCFFQIQAIYREREGCYVIQEYDEYLTYIREYLTDCKYYHDVEEYMRSEYTLEKGLTANVYKNGKGDCTNGGISSGRSNLIIICDDGPTEASDIRACVYIEKQGIGRHEYIKAKPLYCSDRWYMAGGNFLYTSDSRFKEVTGCSYPVPIHDRYEGR